MSRKLTFVRPRLFNSCRFLFAHNFTDPFRDQNHDSVWFSLLLSRIITYHLIRIEEKLTWRELLDPRQSLWS